jgi:hypothetical protein
MIRLEIMVVSEEEITKSGKDATSYFEEASKSAQEENRKRAQQAANSKKLAEEAKLAKEEETKDSSGANRIWQDIDIQTDPLPEPPAQIVVREVNITSQETINELIESTRQIQELEDRLAEKNAELEKL